MASENQIVFTCFIDWLRCSAGSQKSQLRNQITKKATSELSCRHYFSFWLSQKFIKKKKLYVFCVINCTCKGSCFFVMLAEIFISERGWSPFRATQFCLLANRLPIIFCLIACCYQGERLDQRSCEALEVVLKSLHFDFINLQAAQLEENVSLWVKVIFFIFIIQFQYSFIFRPFPVSD